MPSQKMMVGIFLVGGAVLFGVGLFFIGSRKQAFSRHLDVHTEFTMITGLQKGSKVRVSGMDAGEVEEITVPNQPGGRFRLKLRIESKLSSLVRQDSLATIETEGLVGNQYLEIRRGTSRTPQCASGCVVPSREPFNWGDLMVQATNLVQTMRGSIEDVQHNADAALRGFADVTHNANSLVVSLRGDLKEITSNGSKITQNLDELVVGIRGGRGLAGRLLTDDKLSNSVAETADHVRQTASNVEQASGKVEAIVTEAQQRDLMGRLEKTLENTRSITQQLDEAFSTFLAGDRDQNAATNLRHTVASARQTMANLADDTEALKRNFFFRGFFKKRGYYNLERLTPEEYRKSRFVSGESSQRIWLTSAELFSSQANGREVLSPSANSRLDQAFGTFVPSLPNRPVMIEGYASAGTPAERYGTAQQRASIVCEYLKARFQLKPELLGIMPLGETPPPGSGRDTWDGVSLVLLK